MGYGADGGMTSSKMAVTLIFQKKFNFLKKRGNVT